MLTEKSKVKNYLGISDEMHDSLFDDLCAGISQFIVTYCDRDILTIPSPTEPDAEQVFFEEYFDSNTDEELMLRNYPVRTLLKVEYNSRTQDDPLWVELEPSRYVVYRQGGIIHLYGKFTTGLRQSIKVTYNGGYDEVPADIAMVATELVAKIFEKRRAQGKSVELLGGARIDWINKNKKHEYFSTDGNVLAMAFGISNKQQDEQIIKYIEKFILDKIPMKTNHPNYPWWRVASRMYIIGTPGYQNNFASWLWLGCVYAVALHSNSNKEKAKHIFDKISFKIEEYDKVYEIYAPDGLPYRGWYWKSAASFAWSSGLYLWMHEVLKQ